MHLFSIVHIEQEAGAMQLIVERQKIYVCGSVREALSLLVSTYIGSSISSIQKNTDYIKLLELYSKATQTI